MISLETGERVKTVKFLRLRAGFRKARLVDARRPLVVVD
jgi:hypothetical protein